MKAKRKPTLKADSMNNDHLGNVTYATLDIFKNLFAYRGPFIRNALPDNIKKCVTLSGFKIVLKAYVLNA